MVWCGGVVCLSDTVTEGGVTLSIPGGHAEGPASTAHVSGKRCTCTHLRCAVVCSPCGCVQWHAADKWCPCCLTRPACHTMCMHLCGAVMFSMAPQRITPENYVWVAGATKPTRPVHLGCILCGAVMLLHAPSLYPASLDYLKSQCILACSTDSRTVCDLGLPPGGGCFSDAL